MTDLPDMMSIPIGPGGIADRQKVIELLEAQIAQMREGERQARDYYDQEGMRLKQDWEKRCKLSQDERRDLERLRSKEMKILERWVRRRAITNAVVEKYLLIATGASIVIPLFIVLLSLAWRLAVWAVLT